MSGKFDFDKFEDERVDFLEALGDDEELLLRNINLGSEDLPERIRSALKSRRKKKWRLIQRSEQARADDRARKGVQ